MTTEAKTIKEFTVNAGEEFNIHIAGPIQNIADPSGLVGGTTIRFKASEDRMYLQVTRATHYSERIESQPVSGVVRL